jgi:hypothetical protein
MSSAARALFVSLPPVTAADGDRTGAILPRAPRALPVRPAPGRRLELTEHEVTGAVT